MTKLEALTTIIKQSNLDCDGIDCANCPFNTLESKHSHTTPDHYRLNPEPIDVIRGWNLGFCLGNVIKYIARAGHKAGESRDKDLHKAMEYLRMELEDE